MAEEEKIREHAKHALQILIDKTKNWKDKIKDFIWEVLIILVAVNITIWFHNWSDHRKEQKEVKIFLLGLKKDITTDIDGVNFALSYYDDFKKAYKMIAEGNPDKLPDGDSLRIFIEPEINSNYNVLPSQSRFNGFLSSGKITNIEDDNLQLEILGYYQYIIPIYLISEREWNNVQKDFWNFRLKEIKDSNDDKDFWGITASSKGRTYAKILVQMDQLKFRLAEIKNQGENIIEKIDSIYPTEK